MSGDLNKELSRLKGLKGNKDKSVDDMKCQALVNLRVREFRHNPLFIDPDEAKLSEERFRSYLITNEIESISEIDTLRSLIYNEVFETRIQKQLNQLAEQKKVPPDKLTKQLTDIQNQKMSLKIKLGVDKNEDEIDELTGLQILKKRFKNYINAHREEFTVTCSHGTPMLLRRRVKDFDSMEHPWFAGRWFFNYEILKDVKDGKLSKEDAWRYLCCASQGGDYKPAFDKKYCIDYIEYCLNHWAEITEHFKE